MKELFHPDDMDTNAPKGAIEFFFENHKYVIPASCIEKDSAKSGGPGGQHVNKTESKAILRIDTNSPNFPWELRERLVRNPKFLERFPDGIIHFESSEERSWHQNLDTCVHKFRSLVTDLLTTPKERKATKPPHLTKKGKIRKAKQDRAERKRQGGRRGGRSWETE